MPRTTKLITVSLPSDLAALAEKACKEESRTKSELLREALREYVLSREVRRAAPNASPGSWLDCPKAIRPWLPQNSNGRSGTPSAL